MNVVAAMMPTPKQMEALLQRGGAAPIVMLNLLKFREWAAYEDPQEPAVSGRAAYLRYGEAMRGIVEAHRGRFLFSAQAEAVVIGEVAELWDAVALVEYPSRADFVAIATLPEVARIGRHRTAGLQGQLLIQLSAEGLSRPAHG